MTRSTTELLQIGLEATTFVLIRQMLKVAFEAVEVCWPVCGSYSPCADIWTPSRPPHRHNINQATSGRSLFLCAFSTVFKIFGATFEKNTNFVMRLSRQAHDREICLNPAVAILRRTSHCAETVRFLPHPPLFFWQWTQHPLVRQVIDENEVIFAPFCCGENNGGRASFQAKRAQQVSCLAIIVVYIVLCSKI